MSESLTSLDVHRTTRTNQYRLKGIIETAQKLATDPHKAHRLAREAKVIAAMQALPDGSVEDGVAHAYADVPQRIWPVAQRSLIAHVERIRALGPGND